MKNKREEGRAKARVASTQLDVDVPQGISCAHRGINEQCALLVAVVVAVGRLSGGMNDRSLVDDPLRSKASSMEFKLHLRRKFVSSTDCISAQSIH